MVDRDCALDFFARLWHHGPRNHQPQIARTAGSRTFILVEMGDYFDTALLPRIKKVTFSPEWKGGKPEGFVTPEETERSPHIVKVIRLDPTRTRSTTWRSGARNAAKPARPPPMPKARGGSRNSTCYATCSTSRRAAASRC